MSGRRWAIEMDVYTIRASRPTRFGHFPSSQEFNFTHFSQCDANTQVWFGLGTPNGACVLTLPKAFSKTVLPWVEENATLSVGK